LVQWLYGDMAQWFYGYVALWLNGYMAQWISGSMVPSYPSSMAGCMVSKCRRPKVQVLCLVSGCVWSRVVFSLGLCLVSGCVWSRVVFGLGLAECWPEAQCSSGIHGRRPQARCTALQHTSLHCTALHCTRHLPQWGFVQIHQRNGRPIG
jgi:hypothetical protein